MTSEMGKLLIVIGVVLVLAGMAVLGHWNIPWLGKLPGDMAVKRENFSFYFPITTCILVSVVLTFILSLFRK